MISLGLAAALVLLLAAVRHLLTFRHLPSWRTITMFNKLPGPKYPFFIGVLWKFLKLKFSDFNPLIAEHFKIYDGLVAVYSAGIPVVFINDPYYMEAVLSSQTNITKGFVYEFLRDWFGDGLILSTGQKWRKRRKMLTPSFHYNILNDNLECMNRIWKDTSHRLLEARGAPFEAVHIVARGSLSIICETAMGTPLEQEPGQEEYIEAVKRTAATSTKRMIYPALYIDFIYYNTASGRQRLKDLQRLHEFSGRVIRQKKSALVEEKKIRESEFKSVEMKRKAFLDILLGLSEEENLSDSDILEEVDTFMAAGYETVSVALNYALFFFGLHPHVQDKAYKEQVEIFGYSDREVTKDDLSRMQYLEQVIKESLRLCPAVPQVIRQATEDIKCHDGLVIPEGTTIVLSFLHLHQNRKYYPDPEKFDPDRFTADASKDRHPYSFLPFSGGPRNCIGQKFAMMEMKIGLSRILRRCKINAVSNYDDLVFLTTISLGTTSPVLIDVAPRY